MAAASVEVLGTVRPDGTLELREKLNVSPGPVRVRVESVAPADAPAEGLVEFVARLRRELEAGGHPFRTKEEIDAEIAGLRDEWDDHAKRLERTGGPFSGEEKPEC